MAQNGLSAYTFNLKPNFGILWGYGEEIVLQEHDDNSSPYTSQLLWDLKPLVYLGFDLEFSPRNLWEKSGFYAELSFKYALPLKTGVVENRDWLSPTDSFLTNYSQHNASSRSGIEDLFSGYGTFMVDLSTGFSWALNKFLWIRAYGELSFMRFSWKSQNGFFQYGPNDPRGLQFIPWDPGFPKIPYPGPAIGYSQNWIIFSPGIKTGILLTDNLSLSIFALCSPLIYGYCKDEHFARNVTFMDYLYYGLYFQGGGELNYYLNNQITFGLSTIWKRLTGARGETHEHRRDFILIYPDNAGGGFSFLDISFSLRYTFQ